MDWKKTAEVVGLVAAPLVVAGAAVAVASAGRVKSNPRRNPTVSKSARKQLLDYANEAGAAAAMLTFDEGEAAETGRRLSEEAALEIVSNHFGRDANYVRGMRITAAVEREWLRAFDEMWDTYKSSDEE